MICIQYKSWCIKDLNSVKKIGGKKRDLDHLLFHCPFLTQSRELVKGWLRLMGCQSFNRQTIIEMTGIQSGIANFAISTYKYVIWKNRNVAKLRPVSKNTMYNVLERTVSFYISLFLNRKEAILYYGCLYPLTKDMTHNVAISKICVNTKPIPLVPSPEP